MSNWQKKVAELFPDVVQNVKDYGAIGNDSHDDSAAIQSAIDAGGMIFIPEGIYKTTVPINIPANTQLIIQGEGIDKSIIHYTGTLRAINAVGTSTDRCFFVMRDLAVRGENDGGNPANGIELSYVHRETMLENVFIYDFKGGAGIKTYTVQSNSFIHVMIKFNLYGVYFNNGASDSANAVNFVDCLIENNDNYNLYIQKAKGVNFRGCTIEGSGSAVAGTYILGDNDNISFSDCWFEEPAPMDIRLEGTSPDFVNNVNFINCRIINTYPSTGKGVYFKHYVSRVTFDNCNISSASYGVFFEDSATIDGVRRLNTSISAYYNLDPQTSAPTVQTWTKGEIVQKMDSDKLGSGWICSASGTPGTWIPFPYYDIGDYGGGFSSYTPPAGFEGEIILAADTNATTPGQRIYAYINGAWHYIDLT